MTTANNDQIDDLWLSVNDATTEIARLLKEKSDKGDQRSRNLIMIRQGYEDYLKNSCLWKEFIAPGIPIVVKDGDLRFDRMLLHTKLYTRAWFEERPQGGTEIIYTSQHRGGAGFQWYFCTWKFANGLLEIRMSHWLIQRDIKMKRNTIYFTRSFSYKEKDTTQTKGLIRHVDESHILKDCPLTHKKKAHFAAKHALRNDIVKDKEEGWTTIVAPYGMFEQMFKIHSMMKNFDMGEHSHWYLDRKFKQFWDLRVMDAVFGEGWHRDWSTRQIDKDGVLKELWYHPNTTHILDKERFERIYEDWLFVEKRYREWLGQFRDPPHLQAPPPAEHHLLELSDERKQEIQEKADEEEERQRKNKDDLKRDAEAVRKANELFNQPPPTTNDT